MLVDLEGAFVKEQSAPLAKSFWFVPVLKLRILKCWMTPIIVHRVQQKTTSMMLTEEDSLFRLSWHSKPVFNAGDFTINSTTIRISISFFIHQMFQHKEFSNMPLLNTLIHVMQDKFFSLITLVRMDMNFVPKCFQWQENSSICFPRTLFQL